MSNEKFTDLIKKHFDEYLKKKEALPVKMFLMSSRSNLEEFMR